MCTKSRAVQPAGCKWSGAMRDSTWAEFYQSKVSDKKQITILLFALIGGCELNDRPWFRRCSREKDEHQYVEQGVRKDQAHHRPGAPGFEHLTNQPRQDHPARAGAEEKPARDRPGDMHPFLGECHKRGKDRCLEDAEQD